MRAVTDRITSLLDPFIQQAAREAIPAAVVHINHGGEAIYQQAVGWLDPEARSISTSLDSFFDLASLTKLFTATAFLSLVAAGKVRLDEPVARVLPAFTGERPIRPYEDPLQPGQLVTVSSETGLVNAGEVTFRQLLTHTSGLPAWRPFYRQPFQEIPAALLETFFSYPPDGSIVYSDLGFMLLGQAIAQLTTHPLDAAINQLVFAALPNPAIQYGPVPAGQAAPTEYCDWRSRRMRGEVHDENAWALGGVAGHAGLFGTAAAVASFGQTWLADLQGANRLLPQWLAAQATGLQAEDGVVRRGLGWAAWSPDPDSPGHPLSRRSFGHTGFTGTSLYVDPERELVVACLTNEVSHGRNERRIGSFRVELHKRVVEAL
jgi:serine-type D-Ala-D-Ala carboxypeptidase